MKGGSINGDDEEDIGLGFISYERYCDKADALLSITAKEAKEVEDRGFVDIVFHKPLSDSDSGEIPTQINPERFCFVCKIRYDTIKTLQGKDVHPNELNYVKAVEYELKFLSKCCAKRR